uniref:Uncharacterized protein n=1 Tax=Lactuca sativa TaxID=4236 RepID=A0A9R1XBY0_LACSA|nr:hypothetical protein LSAT_V11C500275460 [Lactuca sativa]
MSELSKRYKVCHEKSLDENAQKTKVKRASVLSDTSGVNVDNMYDYSPNNQLKKYGKRKAPHTSQTQTVPPFFKRGMHDPSQPSIKATLQSKERWHDTDLALTIKRENTHVPFY